MEFISMQELIEKLSPHDKAALIHVVEIHDKYCQQCIKHKELKHECSDQHEAQLIDTTIDHIETASIINCSDHGSDKTTEDDVECKDQDPYNNKSPESQGWSDTPLCMDVDNEEQSDDSCLHDKVTDCPEVTQLCKMAKVSEKGPVDKKIEVGGTKTTKCAIHLFKKWLKQNGINQDFEYLAVDKIAEHVRHMGTTKTLNRNLLYPPRTMHFIRSSVMQYLNSQPYNRRISQEFFKMSTENRKTTENTNMYDLSLRNPITQPDLRKIYTSGIFGNGENYTPKLLLYKVWFELTLHFSNFLRKNGSRLRREELKIATDEKGRLFCTFCLNEMVDTRWMDAPRIYSMPGNPFCPMKSILLYISHLNPNNDLLFQKPAKFFKHDAEWYTSSPLSQHTIKKIMKVISKSAGLSSDYPNICVRETAFVILYEAGLWDDDEYKKCWVRGKGINVGSRKEEIFLKLQQYIHGDKGEITQPISTAINKQAEDEADQTKPATTINMIDNSNVQVAHDIQKKQQNDISLLVQQTKNQENTEEQKKGTNQQTDSTATRQTDTEISKILQDEQSKQENNRNTSNGNDGIMVFDYMKSISNCQTNMNQTSTITQSSKGSQPAKVTSNLKLPKHVIIRAPYNSVKIENIQSDNSNLLNPAYKREQYNSGNTTMANKKPFMPVLKVPPTSNQDKVLQHQQVSAVSKFSPGCSYMIPHTSWSDNQGHVNYLFMNTNQSIPKTNVEQKDKLPLIQVIDKKNTQESKYVNCKESNANTMMEKTHSIQATKEVITILAKPQECLKTQGMIQRKSSSNDSRTCKVTPIVRHKPTEKHTMKRSEQTRQQHANIEQKNTSQLLDVTDVESPNSSTENPTMTRSEQARQQHGNIKQKNTTQCLDVPDIESPNSTTEINSQNLTKTKQFVFVNKKGVKCVKTIDTSMFRTQSTETTAPNIVQAQNLETPVVSLNQKPEQKRIGGTPVYFANEKDSRSLSDILHKNLTSAKMESCKKGNSVNKSMTMQMKPSSVQMIHIETVLENHKIEHGNISEDDRTSRERAELNMNTNSEENIAPIISFDEKSELWVVQNMNDFLNHKMPSKSYTDNIGRKEMPTKHENREKSKISSENCIETDIHYVKESPKPDYKIKAGNLEHIQTLIKEKVQNLNKRKHLETLIQEKVHNLKKKKQRTQVHVKENLDSYSKTSSLHVISGAQKVEVKEKLQKCAFDEVTEGKNLLDRQKVIMENSCNFLITDVKSIDTFNTDDTNWRAEENNTDENNNSEIISENMIHGEVEKIPETVVNNTDPKVKSESNFDEFLPKFQQQFSQRKDKIAKILKKIQADSKRLEILKTLTKRSNTMDVSLESESNMEHFGQNIQSTEISTERLAEEDKNKLPHEFVEKPSHTGHLMKPKRFVFKKRKQCNEKGSNKTIVQQNTETEENQNDLSETEKEHFTPLKLAFRKKEGNEYEIIKYQNSNNVFYSPSFSKDSPDDRNILQKKERNKSYGEKLAEYKKRKSLYDEKDERDIENREFYIEQNNEKEIDCTSVPLPFKKRIRINHSYQTQQRNSEEEDQHLNYSLTEKEIFSDSDWSLSDEPSLLKCVNTATFNFADIENDV
ncbi:KCTD1_15 [Mytilus edulis]|uniref:KCTD1_15 n=1 Tax=Mytilus edulis TaxID=6550 RepID=A0A8S3PXV2_MYTED|nr:KCTD1_15 [Mytilus edulis]